jgi:MYXO-CTERM domain-containing protein
MRNLILATALAVASTMSASAALVSGSLPFAGFGVTQNNTNLSTSTVFTPTTLLSDFGTGDLAVIPVLTPGGPGVLDLNDLGSYTFTFGTWGTFDASNTPGDTVVVSQSANFLDVYLLGTFTPGASLLVVDPTYEATPTSVRLSLNQSGDAVSYAGTLTAPPANIPEPSATALGLTGLATILLVRRRRA